MSKNLAMAWLQGASNPEEKKSREDLVRNSVLFSTLLLNILYAKADQVERKGYREEDYALDGWQTLHAFRNGKIAAYNEIIDLFNHLNPDKG